MSEHAGAAPSRLRRLTLLGQGLLALLFVCLLVALGVSSATRATQERARAEVLSTSESQRNNSLITMRDGLGLVLVVEQLLNGQATRRDVQIARALLAQRLSVVAEDNRSALQAAPESFRVALAALDAQIASLPAGLAPVAERSALVDAVTPASAAFSRETRHLGDGAAIDWRAQARVVADRVIDENYRETALLVAALFVALLIAAWVTVDVRRVAARTRRAMATEREGLHHAQRALERVALFDREQSRILERIATGGTLADVLQAVVDLASRTSDGRAFRLRVDAVSVVSGDVGPVIAGSLGVLFSWPVGGASVEGVLAGAGAGQLELLGTGGLLTEDVAAIALSCSELADFALEHDRVSKQLSHMATHDALTGLANRNLLLIRLSEAMRRGDRSGDSVAVLFCDLDNFKQVNDSLGHFGGDQLLIEVARRLEEATRQDETVARFGGDEFIIIASSLPTESDAYAFADRIRTVVGAPFQIGETDVSIGISIGITFVDPGMGDAAAVLLAADAAMYREKSPSRGVGLAAHLDPTV
ncbi:unannotated protein [freshwater metagenome]|uniref:Unannotated protein n=1 Tax=freshwater metagenome TaxID=449393 RepID=A0A6J7JQW1_9ZZZZ|nr:diguanylate cyclase [Actinomycetota bacterium]